MKFVLLFISCLCFIACSAEEKKVNSTNQPPVNTNKTVPNANQTPIVANNVSTNNSVKNTANSSDTSSIKPGEKFTLKNGEKRKIKDTNLELKVTTAGTVASVINQETKQVAQGVAYCRVDATLGSKTDGRQLYTQPGKNEFVFEGFKIQVQEIVPTGNISCTFIVTKS